MTANVLRPRTGPEIVDAAFQLLRRHYGPLCRISLFAFLPVLVVQFAFLGNPVVVALANLGTSLATILAEGALLAGVSSGYLEGSVHVGPALRGALRRFWALFATRIIQGMLISIGLLGLVIGAFWMYARLFAMPAAIVLEERSVDGALERAGHLSREAKVRISLTMLLVYIAFYAIVFGISAAATGALASTLPTVAATAYYVVYNLASALFYPLVTTVAALLYYDLRIRKDGFDIEVMAGALERGSALAVPS